jgi:hypothetical protein
MLKTMISGAYTLLMMAAEQRMEKSSSKFRAPFARR